MGGAGGQAKNWRRAACGSLLRAGGFAGALVGQSARGTIVPWVVQVDQLGQAQAVEPAVADYRPTDPQVAFHLGRFIEQVRSIPADPIIVRQNRSEEHTSELQSLMRISYAVFCLKKKKINIATNTNHNTHITITYHKY